MRFAVETWAPAYGASIESLELEATTEEVEVDVECPAEDWVAHPAVTDGDREEMVFVDGVRRIDARVWTITENGPSQPGICASVAAGAVISRVEEAKCELPRLKRLFVTADPTSSSIETKHGSYEIHRAADESVEARYAVIQKAMFDLELEVSVATAGNRLVVFDGPLRGRKERRTVGMIKTHHRSFLEGRPLEVASSLEPGARTPLFRVKGQNPRYAWYLQLPCEKVHPWSGVVRCETSTVHSVDEAVELARSVSGQLPRYASAPHKDPRAPQNLYPIAGLEQELKRRLGDPRLLEMGLRRAAGGA